MTTKIQLTGLNLTLELVNTISRAQKDDIHLSIDPDSWAKMVRSRQVVLDIVKKTGTDVSGPHFKK